MATTLSQLLQHATRKAFDAAIVVLDDLTVPTNSPSERIDAVLDALPQLQVRGAMPVTAMSVYCPNSDFIERVRDAGANAFLLLPAEPYAIQGGSHRRLRQCCPARFRGWHLSPASMPPRTLTGR